MPPSTSRRRPDGFELRWRLAGLQETRANPSLPFFIQWEVPDDQFPGRAGGEAQASGARIAAVDVAGDEAALADWLGDVPGAVRVTDGEPGLRSVAVAGAGGVEVLQPR